LESEANVSLTPEEVAINIESAALAAARARAEKTRLHAIDRLSLALYRAAAEDGIGNEDAAESVIDAILDAVAAHKGLP
jgi:hypothetical protein